MAKLDRALTEIALLREELDVKDARLNRVRAHIFLCMLAYYVQRHMVEALRPLLYADEDQQAKDSRDPVAPATRSEAAMRTVHTKKLPDGSRVHSFRSLLNHLSAIVRNTCRCPSTRSPAAAFTIDTNPDPQQQRALDLLKTIHAHSPQAGEITGLTSSTRMELQVGRLTPDLPPCVRRLRRVGYSLFTLSRDRNLGRMPSSWLCLGSWILFPRSYCSFHFTRLKSP